MGILAQTRVLIWMKDVKNTGNQPQGYKMRINKTLYFKQPLPQLLLHLASRRGLLLQSGEQNTPNRTEKSLHFTHRKHREAPAQPRWTFQTSWRVS